MENIYNTICEELLLNKSYTKKSIENLFENKSVTVKYEDDKPDQLCEILFVSADSTDHLNYVKITNGGLYLIVELFIRQNIIRVEFNNKKYLTSKPVLFKSYSIRIN